MDYLPKDLILYIKEYFYDYTDLLNLKNTCKDMDKLITDFSLKKLILYGKFTNYKHIKLCINIDCYYDTQDIYEDVYYHGYRRYIHSHQDSLNKTIITINNKRYNIFTPYCCECFKNMY